MKFDRERVFLPRFSNYAYVVRTTDLGPACGAEGLVLCELYSVYLGDKKRNERAAWFDPNKKGVAYKRQLAMALVDYGYGTCEHSFVIQVRTRGINKDTWGTWGEILNDEYGKGTRAYRAAWRELCDYVRYCC